MLKRFEFYYEVLKIIYSRIKPQVQTHLLVERHERAFRIQQLRFVPQVGHTPLLGHEEE
jgi:hypothetical protein